MSQVKNGEALSLDNWRCPICFDVLHKPCVNACGHAFCFWCFHKSMNPYSPSSCPLCRAACSHFPMVSSLLCFMIANAFPEAHRARDLEVQEEERRTAVSSPEVWGLGLNLQGVTAWSDSSFQCANPRCCQLLYEPAVLSCGHAVCHATCVPFPCGQQQPQCPQCRQSVLSSPSVCRLLHDSLLELFPDQMKLRSQEVQQLLQRRASGAAACAVSSTGRDAGISEPARQAGSSRRLTLQQLHELVMPERGGNVDWQRVQAVIVEKADTSFTWYMVGCDACGHFPIVGRRYRCQDCPEWVGYDLCGMCYEAGQHRHGRFNQAHQACHRVSKVDPTFTPSGSEGRTGDVDAVIGMLNCLQVVHPDMRPDEVWAMFNIEQLTEVPEEAEQGEQGAALRSTAHEAAAAVSGDAGSGAATLAQAAPAAALDVQPGRQRRRPVPRGTTRGASAAAPHSSRSSSTLDDGSSLARTSSSCHTCWGDEPAGAGAGPAGVAGWGILRALRAPWDAAARAVAVVEECVLRVQRLPSAALARMGACQGPKPATQAAAAAAGGGGGEDAAGSVGGACCLVLAGLVLGGMAGPLVRRVWAMEHRAAGAALALVPLLLVALLSVSSGRQSVRRVRGLAAVQLGALERHGAAGPSSHSCHSNSAVAAHPLRDPHAA